MTRPSNPISSSCCNYNNSNPFAPTRQIPRTPVRNTNRENSTRRNIASMNNNLRLNLVTRNNIRGLNFNRQ